MKIGIDIDDVITNTSEKIKEYLYKYEKSGDGIKHIVEVMRGESPTQNIKNFFNEYMSKIFFSFILTFFSLLSIHISFEILGMPVYHAIPYQSVALSSWNTSLSAWWQLRR